MKGDFAIIPAREFASAKLRLKNDLTAVERNQLASTLLKRVIRSTERSRVDGAVVVASKPSEALSFVQDASKVSVIPETNHHGGVNSAMQTGIKFAISQGAKRVALCPSDLPLITPGKINEAFDLLSEYDIVLNPSVKKDGTNLLAMSSFLEFELHYDDDSFARHSLEAKSRKLKLVVLSWKEFSFDLDDANDLKSVMTLYRSKSLTDLLSKISHNTI